MIRPAPIVASLGLHAAVIAAAVCVQSVPPPEAEMTPIEFQLVEESAVGGVGTEAESETIESPPVEEPPTEEPAVEESAIEERRVEERAAPVEAVGGAPEEQAEVVAPPESLNRISPVYPRRARREGHEGSVTVEATVGTDGSVVAAAVVESSGHRELDEAAVKAVKSARFAPATLAGATISSSVRLTFDFRLTDR